jgi:hypothetical protein
VTASKRGDAIRGLLLAVVLAAVAVLPLARSDGARDATPAGLAAASAAGTSATGHRLELRLQERSAPAWPGSQSAHWAVTGPASATAALQLTGTTPVAAPVAAPAVHLLATRGRAPPQALA